MILIENLGVFGYVNITINNAYILYRHSCKRHRVTPNDALAFRLESVDCLLDEVGLGRGLELVRGWIWPVMKRYAIYKE